MTNDSAPPTWTGMVPIDDTALSVTDTGGVGVPVLYCNGQFATQGCWRRVVAELGREFRHITFDERGRGRSKKSADYSFEACVRDVDAVLAARRVSRRPLIVGWSYGAFVAAHWASRNPDRALGAVLVEGAQPHDRLDQAAEARIRRLFKRISWIMPLLRPTGLTPRLNPRQMADCDIELGKVAREANLGPVLDGITVPTRYVLTSDASRGSAGRAIRAGVDAVVARNENIDINARVASNPDHILRKDAPAVADAAREVAALADGIAKTS